MTDLLFVRGVGEHWRPKENIKSKVCIFIKGREKKRGEGNRLTAVIKDYGDGGRTKAAGSL